MRRHIRGKRKHEQAYQVDTSENSRLSMQGVSIKFCIPRRIDASRCNGASQRAPIRMPCLQQDFQATGPCGEALLFCSPKTETVRLLVRCFIQREVQSENAPESCSSSKHTVKIDSISNKFRLHLFGFLQYCFGRVEKHSLRRGTNQYCPTENSFSSMNLRPPTFRFTAESFPLIISASSSRTRAMIFWC